MPLLSLVFNDVLRLGVNARLLVRLSSVVRRREKGNGGGGINKNYMEVFCLGGEVRIGQEDFSCLKGMVTGPREAPALA